MEKKTNEEGFSFSILYFFFIFLIFYYCFSFENNEGKYIIRENKLYKYNSDENVYFSLEKYAVTKSEINKQEVPFIEFSDDIYIPAQYFCENEKLYENKKFSNLRSNTVKTNIPCKIIQDKNTKKVSATRYISNKHPNIRFIKLINNIYIPVEKTEEQEGKIIISEQNTMLINDVMEIITNDLSCNN